MGIQHSFCLSSFNMYKMPIDEEGPYGLMHDRWVDSI